MGFKDTKLEDRQRAAMDAKKALLEKFKAQPGPGHPEYEARKKEQVRTQAEADSEPFGKIARLVDADRVFMAGVLHVNTSLARHYVVEGLTQWEPRIKLRDVVVENDNRNGSLILHINYEIKATQDLRSLVYPFYLEQP